MSRQTRSSTVSEPSVAETPAYQEWREAHLKAMGMPPTDVEREQALKTLEAEARAASQTTPALESGGEGHVGRGEQPTPGARGTGR